VVFTPARRSEYCFAIALTGDMILPWAVGQLAEAHGLRIGMVLADINSLMIFCLQFVLWKSKHIANVN